jgi:hypothetical protein
MTWGQFSLLTEMSTRNLTVCKGRPAHKADNRVTIRELIIEKRWQARDLTTLWASMACYRDVHSYLPFTQKIIQQIYFWFI